MSTANHSWKPNKQWGFGLWDFFRTSNNIRDGVDNCQHHSNWKIILMIFSFKKKKISKKICVSSICYPTFQKHLTPLAINFRFQICVFNDCHD